MFWKFALFLCFISHFSINISSLRIQSTTRKVPLINLSNLIPSQTQSAEIEKANNEVKLKSLGTDLVQIDEYLREPQWLLGFALALVLLWAEPSLASTDTTSASAITLEKSLKYFLAGGIGASFSHAVAVPFDVVKTKKQLSKDMASLSVIEGFKKVVEDEGSGMLFKGLGPTVSGYLVQGSLKYGFYELFKTLIISSSYADDLNKVMIYMIAGACAELIGSSFLSPFEACRIRLVADPNYATGLLSCLNKMFTNEGLDSLFRGLPAILTKQLPYTIVQLSTFEYMATSMYNFLGDDNIIATDYKWVISSAAALTAAILSSLVSQPGDTLLSAVNKTSRSLISERKALKSMEFANINKNMEISVFQIMSEYVRDVGVRGLFVGTKARLLHVSIIVVSQLLVYDYIKALCGIPVTGSH